MTNLCGTDTETFYVFSTPLAVKEPKHTYLPHFACSGKFSPYDGDNHRLVPAFSISSRQRNTAVTPPPACEAYKPRAPARSTFRQSYDRGDFPISLKHDGRGNRITWKVPLESLDYHYYLPLFFDGLRETQHPYVFFAVQVEIIILSSLLETINVPF